MKQHISIKNRALPLACTVALTSLLVSSAATAAGIRITGPSLYMELQGGSMPGTLNDGIQIFSSQDLAFMQSELHADGINTQGHITMFLAETEDGWSFVSLFDGNGNGTPSGNNSFLNFNSSTGITANRHWNTDSGGNPAWWDLGNQTQLVDGSFEWESGVNSEGFAWGNMDPGMSGTATYMDMGLDQLIPQGMFQFLTWGGDGWEVAYTADFQGEDDTLSLAFKVIPTPGTIALLTLAGIRSRRRRR